MARIEKTVEVDAPVRKVYDQWTQFKDFPRFMEGVQEIRQIDDTHLHWRTEIAGKQKEWDAEITEQVPDQRIAWRSTGGTRHNGVVTFEPTQQKHTQVTLAMDYDTETITESVGDMLGVTARRVEADLERFKQFIEQPISDAGQWRGEAREGQVSGRSGQDNPSGRYDDRSGANGERGSATSQRSSGERTADDGERAVAADDGMSAVAPGAGQYRTTGQQVGSELVQGSQGAPSSQGGPVAGAPLGVGPGSSPGAPGLSPDSPGSAPDSPGSSPDSAGLSPDSFATGPATPGSPPAVAMNDLAADDAGAGGNAIPLPQQLNEFGEADSGNESATAGSTAGGSRHDDDLGPGSHHRHARAEQQAAQQHTDPAQPVSEGGVYEAGAPGATATPGPTVATSPSVASAYAGDADQAPKADHGRVTDQGDLSDHGGAAVRGGTADPSGSADQGGTVPNSGAQGKSGAPDIVAGKHGEPRSDVPPGNGDRIGPQSGASAHSDATQSGDQSRRNEQAGAAKPAGPATGESGSAPRSPGRGRLMPQLFGSLEEPFAIMRRMSEEMDRIFDNFMGRPPRASRGQSQSREGMAGLWTPQVEVSQRGNDLLVCIDLPGIKKEEVKVEISDGQLVIEGERRDQSEQTEQGYRRSERSYGHFYRSIPLPDGIDAGAAQASMHDGVLEITLPMPQQQAQPGRRLEIRGDRKQGDG